MYYLCDQFPKYEINKKGDVRSIKYKHQCKHFLNHKGYEMVHLYYADKKKKGVSVHRLLLHTFSPIENESSLQVNHKDGNKRNNELNNLEWVTASQNMKHAHDIGLMHGDRPVYIYCAYSGKYIKKYKSGCEASRELKICRSKVGECCRGIRRRCGDYIASFLYVPILPVSRRVTMKSWKWSKCR
jgi:hypothetical protein